jgi:hypothetical protein
VNLGDKGGVPGEGHFAHQRTSLEDQTLILSSLIAAGIPGDGLDL